MIWDLNNLQHLGNARARLDSGTRLNVQSAHGKAMQSLLTPSCLLATLVILVRLRRNCMSPLSSALQSHDRPLAPSSTSPGT